MAVLPEGWSDPYPVAKDEHGTGPGVELGSRKFVGGRWVEVAGVGVEGLARAVAETEAHLSRVGGQAA